jgi:hypothetical protein
LRNNNGQDIINSQHVFKIIAAEEWRKSTQGVTPEHALNGLVSLNPESKLDQKSLKKSFDEYKKIYDDFQGKLLP